MIIVAKIKQKSGNNEKMKVFFRLMCKKRCHCVNKNPLVLSVTSGDSFISKRGG